MKKPVLILILFSLIFVKCLYGIDDSSHSRPAYIGWFNYQKNIDHANFRSLPGVPNCCPDFRNGEGRGYSFGLDFEFPLPANFFTGFGIGYNSRDSRFSEFEFKQVRSGNEIIDAKIEHVIDARISDVSINPFVSYNPVGGLFLRLGASIGYFTNGTFHQFEQIVEPADRGVFVDTGTRTRNDTSGTIPSMYPVYAGITPEFHYDFKLSDNYSWILSPSVSYTFVLTNIIRNYDWKLDAMAVGLRLRYSPMIAKKQITEEHNEHSRIDTILVLSEDYEKNTVVKGKETISTSKNKTRDKIIFDSYLIRRDTLFKRPVPRINLDINLSQLNVSGQFVTQAFPLVPDVFFGSNSSVLSDFYAVPLNIDSFTADSLPVNAVEYQKNLLNIIGERMLVLRNANLHIKGFCDSVTETSNSELALSRAKSVRDYLSNRWKIEPARLILQAEKKYYPAEHSETRNDSGFSENRRVQLSSDNPELLAPVRNRRFLEPKAINPPFILINPEGSTRKGIVSWAMQIKKGDKVISRRTGNGAPALVADTLDKVSFTDLFSNEPLKLYYTMTDGEGQTGEQTKIIQVVADTLEYEVQRLSLILFGVANAELSDKARNDIRTFLKGVNPNSIIRITGYTDALGSYALNRTLSESRAKNTADFVRRILPDAKIESVRGEASRIFPPGLSSYKTPVERFLSRTVFIEVLNKIK